MGFLSKAWKGVKNTVKKVGDTAGDAIKKVGDATGIDKVITAIPGSKEDAANVAKAAAVAAAIYFGGAALAANFGGAGAAGGAAGAAGGAGAGAGAAGVGAGTAAGLGGAAGMESVLATAPAWGGFTAGNIAAGAGAAGAVGSLYGGSGSTFNPSTVGDGAVGAGSNGSIGTLYGTNSGLSADAMSALAGNPATASTAGSNSSLYRTIGNQLSNSLGNYLGGQQQAQGYEDASGILGKLGQQAGTASQLADPFQQYRSSYAKQLNDTMQGTRSIQTDPGYQFQYNEGQRAVERAANARGMGTSGNMMAALQQRGQDVANQQYGTIIDRLTNLAGAGSSNASAGGQIYGNMMGTALTGQASSALGAGMSNAAGTSGLISGLGSAAGSYLGSSGGQELIGKIGSFF